MTSDNDDLDFLKNAMKGATPQPDSARRAENLALAKKNFAATQGSMTGRRQNSERPEKWGFFRGVMHMLTTRTAAGLTATTALVAVGALFFTPTGRDLMRQPADISRPEVTGEPAQQNRQEDVASAEVAESAEQLTEQPAQTETVTEEVVETAPVIEARNQDVVLGAPKPSAEMANVQPDATAKMDAAGNAIAPASPEAMTSRSSYMPGPTDITIAPPPANSEAFANKNDNPLHVVTEEPVSTFSIDVDTASYSFVRTALNQGQLPMKDAVRVEEMINYFPYDYAAPDADDVSPFRPTVNVFQTPWNPGTQLVHIGLQGEMPEITDRPPLNLVFLVDTSGSMSDPTKLPLLIQSFQLMLDKLTPEDQVAIVTYAGSAGVALEPTAASDRKAIKKALNALVSGGSTNGVGGLEEAYRLADEMSKDGEVSRVLLATDGDFNVGLNDPNGLTDYIAEKRDSGTYLSVLGFGRGNLQDSTMQALAQNGNGTASYIDTLNEAQRVLVDQLAGALYPIADDVKIQVEFNPAVVAEYRLIGYETRALEREDFNNDAVDAGELGAGHSVTAIYEVTPVDSPARQVDPLRYGGDETETAPPTASGDSDELGFLRLRWKEPGESKSQLAEFPITENTASDAEVSPEAEFAAAIAGFGQLLRGSDYVRNWDYADAIKLANESRGEDEFGYRNEAVRLMRLAESLSTK